MKEVQTTHESLKLGQGVNTVNLKPKGFALTKSTLEGTLGVSGPNFVGSIILVLRILRKANGENAFFTMLCEYAESNENGLKLIALQLCISLIKKYMWNLHKEKNSLAENIFDDNFITSTQGRINTLIETAIKPLDRLINKFFMHSGNLFVLIKRIADNEITAGKYKNGEYEFSLYLRERTNALLFKIIEPVVEAHPGQNIAPIVLKLSNIATARQNRLAGDSLLF